jgi:hypothetical protein
MAVLVVIVVAACADRKENPRVVPQVTDDCGQSKRLVTDVCTQLGPTDACANVDDVCVALCDHLTSCTTVGGLRMLNGWAVAPDGYCVECLDQ